MELIVLFVLISIAFTSLIDVDQKEEKDKQENTKQ